MQSVEEQKTQEIIPAMGRIEPAPARMFDISGALAKMQEWEEVKGKILKDRDVVKRSNGSAFPRKSGCTKLAMAANLAVSVVRWEWDPPSNLPGIIPVDMDATVTVVVRVVTSWGRWTEQMGSYSASEYLEYDKKDKSKGMHRVPVSRHTILARAETRGTNRAILRLVGEGEVSAEEVGVFAEEDEEAGDKGKVEEGDKGEEPEMLKRIKADVKDFDAKVVEGADWYGVIPSLTMINSHDKMDALGQIMSTYVAKKELQGGKTIWKVKK